MKKSIKIILILFAFIAIVILITEILIYKKIDKKLIEKEVFSESENVQNSYISYQPVKCRFSFSAMEYAFISHLHYIYPEDDVDMESLNIGFYNVSRTHFFSSNWKINYTGSTEVHNTTFTQLVKMVKEDCSQFQRGHGDYYGDELAWSYSPYDPELEEFLERDSQEFRLTKEEEEEYLRKIENGEIKNEEDIKKYLIELGASEAYIREHGHLWRMIEDGEIDNNETLEKHLRKMDVREDEIKRVVEESGEVYLGPQ